MGMDMNVDVQTSERRQSVKANETALETMENEALRLAVTQSTPCTVDVRHNHDARG